MIGIICAMPHEIKAVLKLMRDKIEEKFMSFHFVLGKLNGIPCVTVLSGVGKVHAAICTQSLITKYNPDFILNIGVAGGIDKNVSIGDIVIASSVVQHDFDISSFTKRKKGEIPGLDLIQIPCSLWITEKILSSSKNIENLNIHTGIIVTGDQFINSPDKLKQLKNNFDGIACEMEAGSIGQTCFVNKIDFGVIRSISDNANNDANVDFNEFIEKSSKNAASILYNFSKLI